MTAARQELCFRQPGRATASALVNPEHQGACSVPENASRRLGGGAPTGQPALAALRPYSGPIAAGESLKVQERASDGREEGEGGVPRRRRLLVEEGSLGLLRLKNECTNHTGIVFVRSGLCEAFTGTIANFRVGPGNYKWREEPPRMERRKFWVSHSAASLPLNSSMGRLAGCLGLPAGIWLEPDSAPGRIRLHVASIYSSFTLCSIKTFQSGSRFAQKFQWGTTYPTLLTRTCPTRSSCSCSSSRSALAHALPGCAARWPPGCWPPVRVSAAAPAARQLP